MLIEKIKARATEKLGLAPRVVFYKDFRNRRQVGAYCGLTSSPWQSGGIDREQGISKAGNPPAPRTSGPMHSLMWSLVVLPADCGVVIVDTGCNWLTNAAPFVGAEPILASNSRFDQNRPTELQKRRIREIDRK